MKNTFKWTLGDWSGDGHNQTSDVVFRTNNTADEIREAYWDSCVETGIALHRDDMLNHPSYRVMSERKDVSKIHTRLFANYDDCQIHLDTLQDLIDLGFRHGAEILKVAMEESVDGRVRSIYIGEDDLSEILFFYITLSLPGFEYEEVSPPQIESINGFWDEGLNVGIGYGIFE